MKENPLVSIIVVNYNGKPYLEECLSSLMKVTYSNFEIILVDNCSTDDSIEFVKNKYPSNHSVMFRHNLLLSYRNFKRYKSSFFINLIGLSVGLASALLIFLWVNDELNVDKFHEKDRECICLARQMN